MKLLNYRYTENSSPRLGTFKNGELLDVRKLFETRYASNAPDWFDSVDCLLKGGEHAFEILKKLLEGRNGNEQSCIVQEGNIEYLPPVLKPSKMLMVGINYSSHAPEPGAKPPQEPYVFIKLPNGLLGHKGTVNVPEYSRQPDNEIELALVIGKRCKDVSKDEAMDCVAGYTVMNDFSFRDLRAHPSPIHKVNWLRLKNLDNAAPMGPWMVTKDEVKDPYNLEIKVRINGKTQQSARTDTITHKIPALLEYISKGITLEPGDIISTGTPLKNGSMTGEYLKDGDLVQAGIEQVGELETRIRFL
ncbi:hypothetical protein IX51_08835 [uncultured archaeon]|nr:hypothetical protein IX51_08835 [uncultured archaeon]